MPEQYIEEALMLNFKSLILLALLFPLTACLPESDDDDDDSDDNTPEELQDDSGSAGSGVEDSVVDITDELFTNRSASCADYVGEYESNVTDVGRGIGFEGEFEVEVENDECIFESNDIPNHDFNDGNANFATNVAEIDKYFKMPTNPTFAASTTELALGVVNVIFLNGVVVDILPAACYGVGTEPLGQEKIGCGSDQIDNPWRYDPMSSLNNFGTDSHNAHVQPDGTYHYHGNPVALFAQDCSSQSSPSPVIGFAADGFPVYGACIDDGNGGIREIQPSFQLKNNGGARQAVSGYTTPVGGTGAVASSNYDGQFRGDYEYVDSLGDLDECNGRTVDGQYGYYVTNSFPWIVNCYKGTVDSSFEPGSPQAMSIKMHGHYHD